jgi:hypothetical protein
MTKIPVHAQPHRPRHVYKITFIEGRGPVREIAADSMYNNDDGDYVFTLNNPTRIFYGSGREVAVVPGENVLSIDVSESHVPPPAPGDFKRRGGL